MRERLKTVKEGAQLDSLMVQALRERHLEASLARGDSWRCKGCGEINGNYGRQCWQCKQWRKAEQP